MKQLRDMSTFVPVDFKEMTDKEREDSLASLIFLIKKQNGDIKDQVFPEGRKQQ